MDSSSNSSSDSDDEQIATDEESEQKNEIRQDLSKMTLEEILKLKEELGTKVYNEAIFGVDASKTRKPASGDKKELKRLNKNRPREMSARRQVPFLGVEMRTQRRKTETEVRDPRFDEKSGTYDVKQFKESYKFVSAIREKEVAVLRKSLKQTKNEEERQNIKHAMQRLVNKNVEDRSWHSKQAALREEQMEIQKAHTEGRQPHYLTKKERGAKELVTKFEELKQSGKLNKHLEKRRKKNTAKDRKKFKFD